MSRPDSPPRARLECGAVAPLAIPRRIRRGIRAITIGISAAMIGLLLLPGLLPPPNVAAFGTINELGQRAEHERITRIALGCPPGKPTDGSCFEPDSLDQLAGKDGSFGAVGAPDSDDQVLDFKAHCDDADFLNQPGYPQSRAAATGILQQCVDHLRDEFQSAVDEAADLLDDEDGSIDALDVVISPPCVFTGGVLGRAKCDVLQGVGRVLHGAQDFYSHSNFADEADPGQPISINNPPGLNQNAPTQILNMRVRGPLQGVPADLSTGFFKSPVPGQDVCPGEDGRITHACLNKDKALIEPGAGVVVNGVTVTGLGNVSDPQTPRGQVGQNALKAVAGAVIESRRQWDDFRLALVAKYGQEKARLMIIALTKDIPTGGLPAIPDAPFIPAIPGAPGGGNPAAPPSLPNVPNYPGIPGIPGLPRP